MSKKKPPQSVFRKGMEIKDWILERLLQQDDEGESWTAHHKATHEAKIIRFIHPKEQLATSDYDLSQSNVEVEVVERNVYAAGQEVDGWTLQRCLSCGNTAEVWEAVRADIEEPMILKLCRTQKAERIALFNHEKKVLDALDGVPGVVPLYQAHLKKHTAPDDPSWYAFPRVTPISTYFSKHITHATLVSAVLDVIDIIQRLKERDVLYSDIKLEHIGWMQERVVLIDFGSAVYPASQYDQDAGIRKNFSAHVTRALANLLGYCQHQYALHHPTLDELVQHYRTVQTAKQDVLNHFQAALQAWLETQSTSFPILDAAIKDYEKKEYAAAKEKCEQVLQQDLACAHAYHLLAVIALIARDFSQSEANLNKALDLQPNNAEFYNTLGQYYEHQKKWIKAVRAYEKALFLKPDYAVAYTNHIMATVHKNEMLKYRQSKRIARAVKQSSLQTRRAQLNNVEKKQLMGVMRERVTVLESFEKRLLVKTAHALPETVKSSSTISWDQYFTDLSHGAYRRYFDLHSRPYHARAWHYFFKNLNFIDTLVKTNQDCTNILDVGCSTGYLRRFLEGNGIASAQRQCFYWGLDVREDVLHRAVYHVKDIESSAMDNTIPALFLAHDVQFGLPFKSNQFDFIICFEFIKYLPLDQGKAFLKECLRVLRPAGRLLISTTAAQTSGKFVGNLSFSQFKALLTQTGLTVQGEFGGQGEWSALQAHIQPAHQPLVASLLAYLPTEIVTAMLIPLYPEAASQRVYHCEAPTRALD